MCYNLEASIYALTVNIIGAVVLYLYDPVLGLYWSFVGLMQLYDIIFWMNQEKNNTNFTFTIIAMISNLIQPFVLGFLVYIFRIHGMQWRQSSLKSPTSFSFYFLLFYFVVLIGYVFLYFKDNGTKSLYTLPAEKRCNSNSNSCGTSNSPLLWGWTNGRGHLLLLFAYTLATITLFIEYFERPMNYVLVFVSLVSLLVTSIIKVPQISRFWCNYIAYTPLLFGIISLYYKKV